jgi:uncharacterized protein with GYD domain
MATYIMLGSWAESGIKAVKDSPKRLDKAKKMIKAEGGAMKAFYMTMGEYDMVAVYEAPDDEAAARFTLRLGMTGSLRTKTMKAFPEADYRKIIGSLE